MIIIYTALDVQNQGDDFQTEKNVMMKMDRDAAFALATVLFNNISEVSDEWQKTLLHVAKNLVEAGNKCL